MRENQEMLNQNISQKEEFRVKLKKREIKIEKLEELIKERDRIMNDMKVKTEETQGKLNQLRLKMEGKLQEKEFKIIALKNQVQTL